MSGGGSEGDGGDDVEWLGEALRAVGVDEALRAVGAVGAVRVEGFGHTLEAFEYFLKTCKPEPRAARWGQWQRPEPRAARWGQWQRSESGERCGQ